MNLFEYAHDNLVLENSGLWLQRKPIWFYSRAINGQIDDRQYNLHSMRSLAEAYEAKTLLTEGNNDYKFPTEMSFDDQSDSSIMQGSTDLVKEMFEYIIQNNAYVVPYIPHLKPKFLAWGAKGVLSEFD